MDQPCGEAEPPAEGGVRDCGRPVVNPACCCVDLPGVDTNLFCDAYRNRDFVTRARSGGLYDEDDGYTGFTRGKGSALTRVYDKLRESEKNGDAAKREVLQQCRWGDALPDHATRVEFQLRRGWLAEWRTIAPNGCEAEARTVEQVFDLLPTISRYLVEHWFRLVDDGQRYREHGNQARAPMSALWRKVRSAFDAWTNGPIAPLTRRRKTPPDQARLVRQIAGLMASCAAYYPDDFHDGDQIIQIFSDRLLASQGDYLVERTRAKRLELNQSGQAKYLGVPVTPTMAPTVLQLDPEPATPPPPRPTGIDPNELPY